MSFSCIFGYDNVNIYLVGLLIYCRSDCFAYTYVNALLCMSGTHEARRECQTPLGLEL